MGNWGRKRFRQPERGFHEFKTRNQSFQNAHFTRQRFAFAAIALIALGFERATGKRHHHFGGGVGGGGFVAGGLDCADVWFKHRFGARGQNLGLFGTTVACLLLALALLCWIPHLWRNSSSLMNDTLQALQDDLRILNGSAPQQETIEHEKK